MNDIALERAPVPDMKIESPSIRITDAPFGSCRITGVPGSL